MTLKKVSHFFIIHFCEQFLFNPALQPDSLPAGPQGKPRNTGVGSLSPLQGIFPTQELNQGLLHCRRVLYQLSYQFSSVQSLSCVRLFVTPCNQGSPFNRLLL